MIRKTKQFYVAPIFEEVLQVTDSIVCTSIDIEQNDQLPAWEDGGEL